MNKIYHVCSLGNYCHTAYLLKRLQLKVCSYPFDWIFTNVHIIKHIIEDNYNIFLDKSYYKSIDYNRCSHLYYKESMFRHHNPLNINEYNYFIRCVNRFNELLKFPSHKLFIIMYVNKTKTYKSIKKNIIMFNDFFKEYTNEYTLLVIYHTKQDEYYSKFKYFGNIHFLKLNTLSESDGKQFMNENDNIFLDNIINNNYTFNL